jgi:hypothetical protein
MAEPIPISSSDAVPVVTLRSLTEIDRGQRTSGLVEAAPSAEGKGPLQRSATASREVTEHLTSGAPQTLIEGGQWSGM